MTKPWTPDQVLQLAPDDSSRKNASGLANPRKWQRLFQHQTGSAHIIWGEIQGSSSDPYRCQVDINGPGYHCSCPSRKLPCKHTLGLFLLYAGQPGAFEVSEPPDWLAAWLAKRAGQAERQSAKAEGRAEDRPSAASAASKARRAAERDQKIRAGLDDLEMWLSDLLRQGLATAQNQPRAFWDTAAGRLVDAQATGLARMVRRMPDLAVSGEGWQDRLLEQVGRLYLALEGYRGIQNLPAPTQADLRGVVGISQKQDDLLDGEGIFDTWLVMGRSVEEEAALKTQRTWLLGKSTGRAGLLLHFAAAGASLDASLSPGMVVPAELVFYESAYPLRAVIRTREAAQALPPHLPGSASLVEATAGYAAALAAYPWLERYPLALSAVRPLNENGEWALYDSDGRRAPLVKGFAGGWTLLALSGGHPIGVFGEWNGERLSALSAWSEGQFVSVSPHDQQAEITL